MTIYKCNKCEYTTKHKQNLYKHINKLNPCKTEIVVYNDNQAEDEKDLLEINDELEKENNEMLELINHAKELSEKNKQYLKRINRFEILLNELGYDINEYI